LRIVDSTDQQHERKPCPRMVGWFVGNANDQSVQASFNARRGPRVGRSRPGATFNPSDGTSVTPQRPAMPDIEPARNPLTFGIRFALTREATREAKKLIRSLSAPALEPAQPSRQTSWLGLARAGVTTKKVDVSPNGAISDSQCPAGGCTSSTLTTQSALFDLALRRRSRGARVGGRREWRRSLSAAGEAERLR
jgi:hypothetical protein